MSNIIKAVVTIKGTRTLVQHKFGPDSISLEKKEKEGVAGRNPEEWKKSCMVTPDGKLYIPGTYVFSCLKNGAIHTKRGRGTMQAPLVSTLQVVEDRIILNRTKPDNPTEQYDLVPSDESIETFIHVCGVRNPASKQRNVRYRLATRPGWKAKFTLVWDKTIVSRETMKAILRDSGILGGLGDGIKVGCGRFEVVSYKELEDETSESNDEFVIERNGSKNRLAKMVP